jgi:hypothetical protein
LLVLLRSALTLARQTFNGTWVFCALEIKIGKELHRLGVPTQLNAVMIARYVDEAMHSDRINRRNTG